MALNPSPKAAKSASATPGSTCMSARRQISAAASAGNAGSVAKAARSASPCAPTASGSSSSTARQSRGKRQVRKDRRQRRRRAASGVEHETAALEQSHAEPGARAAHQDLRVGERVRRQAVRGAKGARQRQRQLGAGAEPRMGGNGGRHLCVDIGRQAQRLREPTHERGDPLGLGAANGKPRRAAYLHTGLEALDGQPERAEAAAEIAVEVEEAEMQTRAGADAHPLPDAIPLAWHAVCYPVSGATKGVRPVSRAQGDYAKTALRRQQNGREKKPELRWAESFRRALLRRSQFRAWRLRCSSSS